MTLRRQARCIGSILVLLLIIGGAPALMPVGARAADDSAVNRGFLNVWQRTDLPAARGDRTFLWGPEPIVPLVITEPMAGLGLPAMSARSSTGTRPGWRSTTRWPTGAIPIT